MKDDVKMTFQIESTDEVGKSMLNVTVILANCLRHAIECKDFGAIRHNAELLAHNANMMCRWSDVVIDKLSKITELEISEDDSCEQN